MVDLSAIGTTLFSSFGCMLIGYLVHRSAMLGDDARKGVATLYAKLVFPTMVFAGVADIDIATIDASLVQVILASKAVLAALVVVYCWVALRARRGPDALAHAAMLAMAASHSFDVTMGVPLCRLLFPSDVAYIYLNQSVQLVIINPILFVLMELAGGGGDTAGGGKVRAVAYGVLSNPLVVMTVLGLAAGQAFGPGGLPAPLAALAKQVAGAGPFLGFLTLGFALATLGGTATPDLGLTAVLTAAKLVLMPHLYAALASRLACPAPPAFLSFLGALPASASVYSLSLTKQLSPAVVGPLVPATMLLCVALCLLPLWPPSADVHASVVLQAGVALGGVVGMRLAASSGGDATAAKKKAA